MARKLSNKEHKKRLAIYNQGLRDKEIAEKIGVSLDTIYRWRKAHGLPRNYERTANDAIRFSLYREGKTDREIATSVGIKKNAIWYWRKRNNLPPNIHSPPHTITKEEHELRLSLYNQGLLDGEIAKAVGLSTPAIWYWRKKNNLPPNVSKFNRLSEADAKRRELYDQGLTDKEIAKNLSVTLCTIIAWRNRRGLKPHPPPKPNYDDRLDEIRALAEKSYSRQAISRELHMSIWTVRRLMREHNIIRKSREIKCVDCGNTLFTKHANKIRCSNCIAVKSITHLEIRHIRHSFHKLCETNIEAAEQMAQEIEREEGKDFRDLALDGILEKTKRQKSNDS